MTGQSADALRPAQKSWPVLLAAAIGGVYALGHLGWFLGTPLGKVPVLDEREVRALAEAIVHGALPAEPFYRAPGYSLFLALSRFAGLPAASLFTCALACGAVLHAVNAGLIAVIASRWAGTAAAAAAGLLWALNPVLVHFAIQAGDATPALTWFLAGLACLAPELRAAVAPKPSRWAAASVLWALAVEFRPNYLLLWLGLPLVAGLVVARSSRGRVLAYCAAGSAIFLAAVAWQYEISGNVALLPTQGAYNLWAANRPGTNGRYYTQSFSLPPSLAQQNPARAESLLLYQQATGDKAPDLAAANHYWRRRFVAQITHHPLAWLGLLLRKTYALLNTWEQYNNETPAFHQARSPWLRWNPLSWGILLVLAVPGYAALLAAQPTAARPIVVLAFAAASSALLFFVSARFRLPLTALLTVLAGIGLARGRSWRAEPPLRLGLVAALAGLAAVITFSRFDGVRDTSTYVQDHALLARASATVGEDWLAWQEARAALAMRPDHPDALRIAVTSYFNLLVAAKAPSAAERDWLESSRQLLRLETVDANARVIAALALWRANLRPAALAEWRRLGSVPAAIAARALVGDLTNPGVALGQIPPAALEPLVVIARAAAEIPGSETHLDATQARQLARRLFGP